MPANSSAVNSNMIKLTIKR